MDSSPIPPRTPSGPPNGDPAAKVLRGIGFALLGGAIAIDVLGPVIVRWRRAAAAKALGWVDQVAPTENVLLDAAVEFLHASEVRRS